MVEVEGECEVEVECPRCKKKFSTTASCTIEVDMNDFAPDYSWRD